MTENNNNKSDWQERELGALWKRQGKNQTYLSGHVVVDELGVEKKQKVVVFSNKNKKDNERAPDFRIYKSVPMNQDATNESVAPAPTPVTDSSHEEELV